MKPIAQLNHIAPQMAGEFSIQTGFFRECIQPIVPGLS
jgi:hypothetical protein